MKISVKKIQNQTYCVTLGGVSHTLSTHDLKSMVLETVRALSPDVLIEDTSYNHSQSLVHRLEQASLEKLQEFILHANQDSLLIFLKCTQTHEALHQKLFDNMSPRKHTILSKDLQYSYQDGLTDEQQDAAIFTLSTLADNYNL